MDLDAVTDALYQVPPADFIAERDAQSAAARTAGDDALAASIKKLRRPTVSAAMTNLLVREQAEQVSELLQIGADLRTAQAGGAADDLRRLMRARQQTIAALVKAAAALGRSRGLNPSGAVQREVQETLLAAVSDPAAAEQLQAGRLTTSLTYSGFGYAAAEPPAAKPPASSGNVRSISTAPSASAASKALAAAEAEWHNAEERALEARRDAQRLDHELELARAEVARLDEALAELRRRQEQRTADRAQAAAAVAAARRARTAAGRAATAADKRAARAKAAYQQHRD